MKRLFIGDDELDLDQNTTIAVNYQINDLGTPDNRQANFSQQFKLPITANNLKLLESSEELQSSTLLPYRKLICRLNVNGIDIMPRAIMIINSVDKYYNVTLYSGNIFLADLLKDKKLSDLDFSSLTHTWNYASIYGSRNNTYVNGYIYAVTEFCGDYRSNGNYDFRNFAFPTWYIKYALPQVFCKYIFNKIINAIGISIYGDFIESNIFKNLIFQFAITGKPNTNGIVYHAVPQSDGFYWLTTDNVQYRDLACTVHTGGNMLTRTGNIDLLDIYDSATGYIKVKDGFTTPIDCKIKIQVHAELGIFTSSPIRLELRKNNVVIGYTTDYFSAGFAGDYYFIYETSNTTVRHSFNTGDIISWNLNYLDASNDWQGIIRKADTYITIYDAKEMHTPYGTIMDMNRVVPDMLQYDFIKGIMQMFGLFIITDNFSSATTFFNFEQIKNNIYKALDWSDKLDKATEVQTVFRLGKYAKRNWFKYAQDGSVPENYGSGYIDIDDTTLENETTVVTLPFSASPPKSWAHDIPIVKRYDDTDNFTDCSPRILLLESDPNLWCYYNDGINNTYQKPIKKAKFIVSSDPVGLGFNQSLLSDNYSILKGILNKSKVITIPLKLSEIDIYQLDHSIPVYFKQFGAYFYINKVNNYTGEGLTKVELIRL